MHVNDLIIFEDDIQPNQQIVINNPGTVVIQSPSSTAGNIPQFNDDIPSQNDQILNNPTVYPQFDGEENLELDPNFKKLKNPSPNMNTNIPVTGPDEQPVFNDDLPAKDQTLVNQPVDNNVAGVPETQPFFNDDPNAVNTNNLNTQPVQPVVQDPNIQQPIFNDDPNQMQQVPNEVAPAPVVNQDPSTQIDPNTGQPIQLAQPEQQIDPNTGMPIDPNMGAVDPTTGMPIDPAMMGGMGMADTFSDDVSPQTNVGNSSEVKIGAAVPLEDLSRINELKKINSQLMRIRGILERELNNKYNAVEDKLNEAIEYFRTIISNLDSFTAQVDDIIFKYKRFILTILTQINLLKKEEMETKNGVKKDNTKSKKDSDKKDTK